MNKIQLKKMLTSKYTGKKVEQIKMVKKMVEKSPKVKLMCK